MPGYRESQEAMARDKTLVVLEAATAASRFSEVVALTGLPKATVHRILTTLVGHDFLAVTREGRYLPGSRFLALTGVAFREVDVSAELEPIAAELAERVGCTVHVGRRNGDEILYLVRADSKAPYTMPSRVGSSIPMHTSALGKAVLAQADDGEVAGLAARTGLPRLTARTRATLAELMHDVGEARRSGYALDLEENVAGVLCIAAPVRGAGGSYAVSISTLALERGEQELRDLAPPLLVAAAAMTAALDGTSTTSTTPILSTPAEPGDDTTAPRRQEAGSLDVSV